jgi:hypothetical protein
LNPKFIRTVSMLRETGGVTNHLTTVGNTTQRAGGDRIRDPQPKPEKRSSHIVSTRAASSVVTILLILIVVAARQRESAHLQVLEVHALTEDDIDYTISAYPLYQGDPAGMNISVVSRSPDDIIIDWIGLQFEWMNKTDWIFKDLSTAPVTVPSLGEADMGAFSFTVPATTPHGYPTLLIHIEYDEETSNGTLVRGNLSMLYNVEIHSTEEKHYQELLPTLSQAIEAADSETLLSPSARDLLQQAETKYYDAISEGQESEWTTAYNSLREAQTLLSQTKDDENRFRTGLTIGTLAVAALTAIVLITKLRRRT